jgi:hypothetical protein
MEFIRHFTVERIHRKQFTAELKQIKTANTNVFIEEQTIANYLPTLAANIFQ